MAPITMSSTLGSVAAVSDTESPSQLNPALSQSRCTVMSEGFTGRSLGMSAPGKWGARVAHVATGDGGRKKRARCARGHREGNHLSLRSNGADRVSASDRRYQQSADAGPQCVAYARTLDRHQPRGIDLRRTAEAGRC